MASQRTHASGARSLADLDPGTSAVVGELALGERDAVRLMELGFIPGMTVSCRRRVPLGDLTVYQVDGAQVAVRRETALRITTERGPEEPSDDANRN